MISTQLWSGVRVMRSQMSRNFGVAAPALQKVSDPIQQLFVDKVRDYKTKSKGGALVEPTPDIERELKAELEKLSKQYGGGGTVDMTKFPEFKFEEPKVDAINA